MGVDKKKRKCSGMFSWRGKINKSAECRYAVAAGIASQLVSVDRRRPEWLEKSETQGCQLYFSRLMRK